MKKYHIVFTKYLRCGVYHFLSAGGNDCYGRLARVLVRFDNGWLKYAQGPRKIRKRVESIPRDSKESLHIQHFCGDAKGMICHALKRLCACVLRYTVPVTSDPYHVGYGGDLWLD